MRRALAVAPPFARAALLDFLARRAIDGVEIVRDGVYARTLRLAGGPAHVAVAVGESALDAELTLSDAADEEAALDAVRRTFDLTAGPVAIDAHLALDPFLAPMVAARPGLRSPGAADGFEMLVRAIVGQQVSVAAGRTTLSRIAAAHGAECRISAPLRRKSPTRLLFPTPERLAEADPAALGMPRAKGRAVVAAARACADGLTLTPEVDGGQARARMLALPGVGPWTVEYVAMRALGDRDAFLAGDLIVRRRMDGGDPDAWRPYRAHAVHHLWASGGVRR